ncbi:MAG: hypothetical protein QUS33_01660, partial [Dehalococcoidia bacterium]|nr:hypothetical protein [Dehalococcoidia bacterium]
MSNRPDDTGFAGAKRAGIFPTKLTMVARIGREASKARGHQEAGEGNPRFFSWAISPVSYTHLTL